MNSLSLSGKNWVLKKFNEEDIIFFKENFSLDEITSKLLSIRQIKKDEINSFLNPSIKNILPNPDNLIDMEKSSKRAVEAIIKKEKIGIFGHSFGGGTAALSSNNDDRIKACVTLDGWFEPIPPLIIDKGINIPFLFIGQPQNSWLDAPYNKIQLTKFYNNCSNDSFILEINDTKHMDYSDISYLTFWSRLLGLSGKKGKKINLDLNFTLIDFFDNYLKNQNKNWLKNIQNNYDVSIKSKTIR